ncbi:hypothetical protein AMATHDRAFT_79094 [Amanita thiersii Skay4041]|uniref:Uncharacterized protein n=1 Tax=Amanita thiersii Skay4041 TaxID=703135 RepID=A0A2A9NRM3_9AGAR|nr:hypothetical protein AMATHDRAFT_79094 [Amanita thiersii Skay4041]
MASDSSASTTPMPLTPDSTGATSLLIDSQLSTSTSSTSSISQRGSNGSSDNGDTGLGIIQTPKRRPTAFYPNMKSSTKALKPFSRSAAKRESVMALGSIEHLQHYFTKTGLVAKKDPLEKPHYGLVPAIGGAAYVPSLSSSTSSADDSIVPEFTLPPLPEVSLTRRPAFPPVVVKHETDPESLLPGVVDVLNSVALAWQIDADDLSSSSVDLGENLRPILTITESNGGANPIGTVDILGLLKTTTRAIRSARNYLLSLPPQDESPTTTTGSTKQQFRPTSLGVAKPKAQANASNKSLLAGSDPSAVLRKSALEVLSVLRDVEERYRLPLSDEAYDAQSDGGGHGSVSGRVASPSHDADEDGRGVHIIHDGDMSVTYSLVQVGGRYESVPVWEDEEHASDAEEEGEKRDLWDERLVLGSGWLYRQDVRMGDLTKERKVILAYLDVVDNVIFGGIKGEEGAGPNNGAGEERRERGWERERRRVLNKNMRPRSKGRRVSSGDAEAQAKSIGMVLVEPKEEKRRVSAGMVDMLRGLSLTEEPEEMAKINEDDEGEESVDDEDLPEWAQRNSYQCDDLGRAHALLSAFLPTHLLPSLSPSTSRTLFLESLSSGQLLCVAYNSCVRKSKKPWGYVSKDGIHDIITLEKAQEEQDGSEGGKKRGWTFRRTDNLRLWVGALKLRYLLPIHTPTQPLTQGSYGVVNASRMLLNNSNTNNINVSILGTSPTRTRFAEPSIMFDAKVVARKDEGWQDMLEGVLLKWVEKAVEEKRSMR